MAKTRGEQMQEFRTERDRLEQQQHREYEGFASSKVINDLQKRIDKIDDELADFKWDMEG